MKIKIEIPKIVAHTSTFHYIDKTINDCASHASQSKHIFQKSLGHLAYRSSIILGFAVAPISLAFDLLIGMVGMIFSKHRSNYFLHFWLVSPLQHVTLAAATAVTTALVLKIAAIATRLLLATPIALVAVPLSLAFLCLPYIYQFSKMVAEKISIKSYSIFNCQLDWNLTPSEKIQSTHYIIKF